MLARRIFFGVYLLAALVVGWTTFMSIMWGVWGAPVSALLYLPLLGILGLLASAVVSWSNPERGQPITILSIVVMGICWIPSITALVPMSSGHAVRWFAYVPFIVYISAAGCALCYPHRRSWSLPAFGIFIVLVIGLWAFAYNQRATRGEYARPTFIFFRWIPAGGTLVIDDPGAEWIDATTRTLLEQSRIEGRLQLLLADGGRENLQRVIVLLQRPPMVAYRLYHPRQGALVHAFDGAEWRTFPSDVPTYPLFSSLAPTPEGVLIFSQTVEGGGAKTATVGNW